MTVTKRGRVVRSRGQAARSRFSPIECRTKLLPLLRQLCYYRYMLKRRINRLADRRKRAAAILAEIELSIVALPDEDLLDLADIFKKEPATALGNIASTEMMRRNIRL